MCYNVAESVSSERVISCLHLIISNASEMYASFVFGLNCIEFKNELCVFFIIDNLSQCLLFHYRMSLVTLLSGLGLNEEEMQCFEQENINLQTFLLLSECDLIKLGISDREKRETIMKIVCNFRSQGSNREPTSRLGPLR